MIRLAFLVVLFVFVGCAHPVPASPPTLEVVANETIHAIKANDMQGLAAHVHPDKGVRFSPYGAVRTGTDGDLVFSASSIPTAGGDAKVYTWGSHDGSGAPIALTFSAYMQSFVYDRDFANAPVIATNRIVKQGNTRVNLAEVYPQGSFVEYHFPGTEEHSGMDWASLRLVFEQRDGRWYLVGISHDHWTI